MGNHAGVRGRKRGVRVPAEAWETFLQHLETMSAIEVSKLPGMPSAPAFVKKRRGDAEFDCRAMNIMNARRLRGCSKPISGNRWADFLAKLSSAPAKKLVEQLGMPSLSSVYKRRAVDQAFRAALSSFEYSRSPLGEVLNSQLQRNDLYAAAAADAVPCHFDPAMRADLIADLILAVLEGKTRVDEMAGHLRCVLRNYRRLFSRFDEISLDTPVKPGSRMTIGDSLTAEQSLSY